MSEPLLVIKARYNKHNESMCALYEDRVELSTACTGGLIGVYDNRTRVIPIGDIVKVEISQGGMGFFIHQPNAVHFIVKGAARTLAQMFRDRSFTSRQYIDEGVQQFCPTSAQDLTEKAMTAYRMKSYIEAANGKEE